MLAALLGRADDSPKKNSSRDGKATSKPAADNKGKNDKSPLTRGLEKLKLPPNAIVVLVRDDEQGLRLVPTGVILKPDKYRELMDRSTELDRRLKPARPASPSTCKLKVVGPVQDDLANLRAEFQFKTQRKDTAIALGCQGANPKRAELDGKDTLLKTPRMAW